MSTSSGYERALVNLFHTLGYDESELHPSTFSWLFGLPSMRIQAFLDWFLTSIREEHSVKHQLSDERDYDIYLQLIHGNFGQGLLYGEQLRCAELACENEKHENPDDSLEGLENENNKLELEIQMLERKLQTTNDQSDRLAKLVQQTTLEVDEEIQQHQQGSDSEFNVFLQQLEQQHQQQKCGEMRTTSRQTHSSGNVDDLKHELYTISQHLRSVASKSTTNKSMISLLPISTNLEFDYTIHSRVSEGDRRYKDFLYQHDLQELEELESSQLSTLKAQISVIAAGKPSSMTDSNTPQTSKTEEGDMIMQSPEPVQRQGKVIRSPWLHESDPKLLFMQDQEELLYNK